MSRSKLVSFGDSWAAGFGVESSYSKILADLLERDHVNMAQAATSNEHMLLQLNDYVTNYDVRDSIAIFFLTSPHRCLFYDHGKPVEVYPWADDSKGIQSYAYFKYLHSHEIEHFRLNQTVLALQKICDYHSIDHYYISGWHRLDLNWPGINIDKIYSHGQVTAADWIGAKTLGDMIDWKDCENVIANDCHPNQQGHQLIAESLYQWIKQNA